MPVCDLPPSCYVVCDECGKSLDTMGNGHDYTVFDKAEVRNALLDYDWSLNGDKVTCDDCAWAAAQRVGAKLPPEEPTS